MTKTIWKIRAEIRGEFVSTYEFESKVEAEAKYEKLLCDGVYETVDMWEIQK